jgi:hypothetical protein
MSPNSASSVLSTDHDSVYRTKLNSIALKQMRAGETLIIVNWNSISIILLGQEENPLFLIKEYSLELLKSLCS